MAPAPRRRYSRIPVGIIESLPTSIGETKPSPLVLYLWLLLSPFRRTLPGVVRAGELMLADALKWSPAAIRFCLGELERAGVVMVDREARVLFVVSAIADDPPRNVQTLKSWAADAGELRGPVRTAIHQAVTEVVAGLEKADELSREWASLTASFGNSNIDSNGDSHRNSRGDSRGTPKPLPLPSPVPEPQPQPQPPNPTPQDLTVITDAFERLGPPFEYAAAAAKLSPENQERLRAIPLEELGPALEGLATSFLAGERAKDPPALLKFINKPDLRRKLIEGEYTEVGRIWSCALCGIAHDILRECAPICRGCNRRHEAAVYCRPLEFLTEQEAERRQEREQLEAEAQAAGLKVEELAAKRSANAAAKFRADLTAVKARIGACA